MSTFERRIEFLSYRLGSDGAMHPEADLLHILRDYEEKYFSEIPPITSIEFVRDLDGPAKTLFLENKIQVDENMARCVVLCSFLVLHELINHKIYQTTNGEHPGYDSPEFHAELCRLWGLEAYKDIL